MSRRRIVRLILLPALAGLMVSLAAYFLLKPAAVPVAEAPVETVPMVVTARDIPAYTRLTADMLEIRRVPEDAGLEGTLSSLEKAVGQNTTVHLIKGVPVLSSLLDLPENRIGLSLHIPDAHRAVTIPVNDLTGLAGHIREGDRIDLIMVLTEDVAGINKATLMVENLRVLALGSAGSGKDGEGDGRQRPYGFLTVAAKPEEAVLIALSQDRAERIQAILRSANDDGAEVGGITVTDGVFQ